MVKQAFASRNIVGTTGAFARNADSQASIFPQPASMGRFGTAPSQWPSQLLHGSDVNRDNIIQPTKRQKVTNVMKSNHLSQHNDEHAEEIKVLVARVKALEETVMKMQSQMKNLVRKEFRQCASIFMKNIKGAVRRNRSQKKKRCEDVVPKSKKRNRNSGSSPVKEK